MKQTKNSQNNTYNISMQQFIDQALQQDIFIYPTDSIYGIGAIVTPHTIKKISDAKQRPSSKYYSIIIPSFERLITHTQVEKNIAHQREKRSETHGQITVLIPYSPESEFPFHLLTDNDHIGIRYLGNHSMQSYITALNQPIITSSANLSGEAPITHPTIINPLLSQHIDCIIDAWEINGSPSTIINYTTKEIIKR